MTDEEDKDMYEGDMMYEDPEEDERVKANKDSPGECSPRNTAGKVKALLIFNCHFFFVQGAIFFIF